MAIPQTFSPIKPQDVTLIPVPVLKRQSFASSQTATTSSGYSLVRGVYVGVPTPINAPQATNDPVNSTDNSYQHIIWQSVNHLYYKDPYNNGATFEHSNRRYTYKQLTPSASILSIPYLKYGETIHPSSFNITSSLGYILQEDKNGNLYDKAIVTSSFTNRNNLVAYWGFNQLFTKFKRVYGTVVKGTIPYISHTFEPDTKCGAKNIQVKQGVKIDSTSSGFSANFDGNSYIITPNRKDFNFDSQQDFTISYWLKAPLSQSVTSSTTNSIISKRGTIYKSFYGNLEKTNQNGATVQVPHVSSSWANELTDIFPYHFEIANQSAPSPGTIQFKRSDGISTLSLVTTSSVAGLDYKHICVTKSGSLVTLYLDGVSHATATDGTIHPVNDHSIVFGSDNINFSKGYSGSLDEIRLYNYAMPSTVIQTLADNSVTGGMYQTAVIGNVFYRKGNVVISSLNPKYQNVLHQGTWTCNYRSKHTIYQYEVLARAKKGSFNMTMNPTARKHPNSDMFRDSITGSLLMPYATTVGLYSSQGDLVAVGKLSQPTQMRGDVDINFLVKWNV